MCAWDNLLTLNLQQRCIKTECEARELFSQDVEILFRQVEAGCLLNIEEISLTAYKDNYPRNKRGVPWKNVKTINILAAVSHMSERTIIEESNILERSKVLKLVVQMVRQGRLPSLEILSVLLPGFPPINDRHVAEDKHILAKSGVCVYISPAGNTPSK